MYLFLSCLQVCLLSQALGSRIFLLRSPLISYNNSLGNQHVCPRLPNYSQQCITALDDIYNYHDQGNIENALSEFCTEACLQPLEKYWKNVIHDVAMPIFMRSTLCKKTRRGYCTQQLIMSSNQRVIEEVDEECIRKWCPPICDSRKATSDIYLQCCANALVNKTFPIDEAIELYGITPKSLHNKDTRQYDYCGHLLMRFRSDSKCLNIIELIDYIHKLVHSDDKLVNNKPNQDLLKKSLESYCPTDCMQIIVSYYTACAGADEALHQLFLYKVFYCSKDGGDYCIVKGLQKMESGDVSKYKLKIYCISPEMFCARDSCKTAINDAKSALGCCCQNLFNIDGSPFRDLIPDFIMRFMECKVELPKLCSGSYIVKMDITAVVFVVLVALFLNKHLRVC